MAAEQSQLMKTALAFIDGYNKWDIDAILAPRAPDCTQQIHPLRLNRPLQTNADHRAWFETTAKPHFQNFHVEILDANEDKERHQVWFHARTLAETAVGRYGNEYVLMLRMTDDDMKLVSFKEFVDSGYSESFFPRLREYLEGEAKKEKSA